MVIYNKIIDVQFNVKITISKNKNNALKTVVMDIEKILKNFNVFIAVMDAYNVIRNLV